MSTEVYKQFLRIANDYFSKALRTEDDDEIETMTRQDTFTMKLQPWEQKRLGDFAKKTYTYFHLNSPKEKNK